MWTKNVKGKKNIHIILVKIVSKLFSFFVCDWMTVEIFILLNQKLTRKNHDKKVLGYIKSFKECSIRLLGRCWTTWSIWSETLWTAEEGSGTLRNRRRGRKTQTARRKKRRTKKVSISFFGLTILNHGFLSNVDLTYSPTKDNILSFLTLLQPVC